MPAYSLIIPLYNRPREIDELLHSLTGQMFSDFEVLVVEDGSSETGEAVCNQYASQLNVRYFYKKNEGPGKARNAGCEEAKSDFFIFLDSDCLVPPNYLNMLDRAREKEKFDAFGGPDAAHPSFTAVQKAINYSMTSLFTTGGIRGRKKAVEQFHPRSFNMGISRRVFEETGGFSAMRFGEDIDFSIRIVAAGFKSCLVPECFVYHKRRTDFRKFFKQVFNSGIARINLFKRHPGSLKLFHFFPSAFTLYLALSAAAVALRPGLLYFVPLILYLAVLFVDSLIKNKSVIVAALSVFAALVQLTGYGLGFLKAVWRRLILRKKEFHEFESNFYR